MATTLTCTKFDDLCSVVTRDDCNEENKRKFINQQLELNLFFV